MLGGVAAAGLAALAAVVVFLVAGKESGEAGVAATLKEAGCTLASYPAQPPQHVTELPKGFEYSSFPPTSGPHHPQPVIWNFYEEPVDGLQAVHNLEHGGVVIQYGSEVPPTAVEELREFWRDDPNGLVVASLPKLEDKIALAAWTAPEPKAGERPKPGEGRLATCTGFDENAFEAFVDEYGFKGPERFPRELLTPGT